MLIHHTVQQPFHAFKVVSLSSKYTHQIHYNIVNRHIPLASVSSNVALTRKGVSLTWYVVKLVTMWLACYKGKASYKGNSDNDVMQEMKWRRERYLGSRSGKAKRLYGTYVRYALYKATLPLLTDKTCKVRDISQRYNERSQDKRAQRIKTWEITVSF